MSGHIQSLISEFVSRVCKAVADQNTNSTKITAWHLYFLHCPL